VVLLSVFPDLGIGVVLAIGFVYAPIFLLIPVIAVETLTLRRLVRREHALGNACMMNVISTAAGFFSATALNAPHLELVDTWVEKVYPHADLYYGEPASAMILWLALGIVVMCVLSIFIEGSVLMVMERRQATKLRIPRTPWWRLWGASLIANVASYSTMVALIWLALEILERL